MDDKILESKLDELSQKFLKTEDVQKINIWREGIKKSAARLKLLESETMKDIMAQMDKWIDSVNDELLNNRDLTKEERDKLFERRDAYSFIKGLFLFDTQRIETMGKNIDEEHKEKTRLTKNWRRNKK